MKNWKRPVKIENMVVVNLQRKRTTIHIPVSIEGVIILNLIGMKMESVVTADFSTKNMNGDIMIINMKNVPCVI